MNGLANGLDLSDFIKAVRAELSDLTDEEQRELLDGLEADLVELVADQGEGALGDPTEYAEELRLAAGLGRAGGGGKQRGTLSQRIHAWLDSSTRRWQRAVAGLPGDFAGFFESARPIWWGLRALVATNLVALVFGVTIGTGGVAGLMAAVVAVVLSVQLGRGKLWPGDLWKRSASLRLLLVALNGFAILCTPLLMSGALIGDGYGTGSDWQSGYNAARDELAGASKKPGIYSHGKWVTNIYPYDAAGNPLVGVQLFDQSGKPLDVVPDSQCVSVRGRVSVIDQGNVVVDCTSWFDDGNEAVARVFYPWTNGATQLDNVFPIPSRDQQSTESSATAFSEANPPVIGELPFANAPAVMAPGIVASLLVPTPPAKP